MDLRRHINITKYLPAVTDKSTDMQAIMASENVVLQELWDTLCDIFQNQFIVTMTDYGLKQWEAIFGLVPKAADTLDDRRLAIYAKLRGQRPYTDKKLEEILDKMCGTGGYLINRDYANYKLIVKINLGVKSQRDAVAEMLEEMVPKNLLLTITLNYNRHIDLQRFTHGTMKQWTHKSLREDVLNG